MTGYSYSPALRIMAFLAAGGRVVRRPSGVLHLYSGPVTPSGCWVPRGARTVCNRPHRRLTVVHTGGGAVDRGGRRFCRACLTAVGPAAGTLVGRDAEHAAFGHLSLDDFAQATQWLEAAAGGRDAQVNHDALTQLRRIVALVHGPAPLYLGDVPLANRRWRLEQRLNAAIDRFRRELHGPSKVELAEAANREHAARVAAAWAQEAQVARAREKADAGRYLMPWERDLINSA